MRSSDWLVLQLADSAFPTGGFSHSGGLEAALELEEAGDVRLFVEAYARQVGHAQLPFVSAAHGGDADRVAEVDAACDAFLTSRVANAASRTQGRAFVATCARVFDADAPRALEAAVRARKTPGHLAPMFGASLAAIGVPRGEAQRLFLFGAVRGVVSAAVRLGAVGTHEAQRMQRELAPLLEAVVVECASLGVEDAAQTGPRIEVFGAMHDTLDARMFQS
jgi:urease accessory protein